MRTIRPIIFLLFWICLFYACTYSKKEENKVKQYSSLIILVDSSANFFLDTPSIIANYISKGFTYPDYDSIHGVLFYKYDSVELGDVTIKLHSMLDTSFTKKIILTKDTSIFFTKSELPFFKQGDPLSMNFSDIEEGEQICISNGYSGCFSHGQRKVVVKKENDHYNVVYQFYPKWNPYYQPINLKKAFNNTFKDTLLDFQKTSIKFLKKASMGWCTTSESYHIRKGNTIYTFYDGTCSNEISFSKILNMIDPSLKVISDIN